MTYPQQPQAVYQPAPKNGMGTAALVLGIIGILLAWIPIIGFFGFILGALALILGGVGVYKAHKGSANNKVMAYIGTGLGAAAFIISIAVFGSFANELDKEFNAGTSSGAPTVEAVDPAQGGEQSGGTVNRAFGEEHSWGGGETIAISTPVEYTSDNPFMSAQGDKRHVQFDVTITNNGNREYNVMSTTLTAQHNGRVAQDAMVEANDFLPNTQLPPGGSVTFSKVYEVGAEPGELQVSVQPNAFAADTVYFKGQF